MVWKNFCEIFLIRFFFFFRPKELVLDDLDRDKFVRIVPPEEIPKREVMLGQRAGKQNYWFHVATSRHEETKIN